MNAAENIAVMNEGSRYSCTAGGAADVSHLDGAVDGSRKEAPPGDGQSCYTALVSQQGLCADHVVHAPHLDDTNTTLNSLSC